MDEGLLVDKIVVEIQAGKPIYDFWMNDSDIIGGSLTDFRAGDGKESPNPNLDLSDFNGLSFRAFTDGKLHQLPGQQFANLYWLRYDWFQRPEIKKGFKKRFGCEPGVPVNWSAYEDIAQGSGTEWMQAAPLSTSFGEDVYREVFGAGGEGAARAALAWERNASESVRPSV